MSIISPVILKYWHSCTNRIILKISYIRSLQTIIKNKNNFLSIIFIIICDLRRFIWGDILKRFVRLQWFVDLNRFRKHVGVQSQTTRNNWVFCFNCTFDVSRCLEFMKSNTSDNRCQWSYPWPHVGLSDDPRLKLLIQALCNNFTIVIC